MEARRVLIVNDSPAEQQETAAALDAAYRAETALTLAEAARRCGDGTPLHCLLVARRLAGRGAGLLAAALPRTPEGLLPLPVVVLADAAAPGEARAALRAGVQDFLLQAELPPAALRLAVDKAIERHALAQEAAARERALQLSEAHHRHALEFNPHIFWSADPCGRLVDICDRGLELLGLTREETLDEGWIQVPHPNDLPQLLQAWAHALSSGEPYDVEHRVRLAGGGYRWMRSRALPRRDAGGRVLRWYGTTEDIDDRRQAEFALRLSEERFRELADNISQLAWAADSDGWVYWFNQRWFDYTGLDPEQSLGWGWQQAHHPEHLARVMEGAQRCWDSGEPWEDLFPLRGRDGRYRWFLSRATPVRAADGTVLRWCGTHTDVTDQRAAEAALRKSEERFRVALAHSPVVVFEQDLELRYRWIYNPVLERRTERILGHTTRDVLGAENAEALDALKRRAMASGSTVRQEVMLLHGDQRQWWDLTVEPARDAEDRVCGVICSAVNRTESKRNELALEESEERLQLALQVARGFAFDWDLASGRVIRSGGFGAILGLPEADEAAQPQRGDGAHHLRQVHPDDRARLQQRLQGLGPQQPSYEVQYRVVRPDGRVVTLEEAARGSFDAQGRLQRLVGMCADVTQRAEAEALLRRHRHELQTLADNTPDLLLRFDRELRCVFANPAAARATGLEAAALLGRTPRELGLPPQFCQPWEAALRRVLDSGQAQALDFSAPPPCGARHYACRLLPECGSEGRVEQVLAVVHDVTAQRLMEREREELLAAERAARAELERIALLKDQFLATLSHELRTPLNAIVGWTHLLRRQAGESKPLQDGLDVISRNARLQTQLIDDLLDMSRILAGKLVMQAAPVDPAAVATLAADSLRLAADRKGVQLELRNGTGLPGVRGDAGRLQQVVSNLLGNAVKFTPAGGRVTLTTRRQADQVQFVVEDTGQGIAAQFLPQLFERFSQADASAARAHDGLGLGLSIVKHLVELHGGSVCAASPGPGLGATFTVSLPALPEAVPQPAEPLLPGPAAPPHEAEATGGDGALAGLSVLLVDDQPDALEPVRRLLKECGARVLSAASGPEALDCLRRERPDLLVSDIGMPGMDGYRLIREVREQLGLGPAELPALALTAFSRGEDQARALAAGFQAHLGKPLEPQLVVSTVARLARRAARALVGG